MQESLDMSVNQTNDADTERDWGRRRGGLAPAMCGCEQSKRKHRD